MFKSDLFPDIIPSFEILFVFFVLFCFLCFEYNDLFLRMMRELDLNEFAVVIQLFVKIITCI
jgi:hypothetical protein